MKYTGINWLVKIIVDIALWQYILYNLIVAMLGVLYELYICDKEAFNRVY